MNFLTFYAGIDDIFQQLFILIFLETKAKVYSDNARCFEAGDWEGGGGLEAGE